MENSIYRQLQKRLDTYSIGFPETESNIEIKILKKLFSEDDVKLFLELSQMAEPVESIAQRIGKPADETASLLEDMARRGLLFRLKRDDSIKYASIPFVHGIWEFQVSHIDRELADMYEQYFNEGLDIAMSKSADLFLRTVPIQQSIKLERHVSAFEDASEILRKAKMIVVADCICRKEKKTLDEGCGKSLEACFMFGTMAKYYIDNNMGRQVDVDEAIGILREAQEAGLVTQPATAQNPGGMCNCCGDCCGVLMSVKKHPKPAEFVFSNYYATVDENSCSGCEICIDRCQMEAIDMNDKGVAEVNLHRCIGCGLCVLTCDPEAMTLVAKPEDERRTPPVTTGEQMLSMAKKRGII